MTESRLVTLIGVGGVGKTRLALRVGAESRKAFRDGVWLVDLAPLSDESQVAQAVLSALAVRDQSARRADDKLVDQLRGKQLLMVLDNCEHVLHACAVLADGVLRGAPGVRILATSREPLGIDGEHLLTVPPLSAPEVDSRRKVVTLAHYDAVQLLVDRARGVRPDFAVTEENQHAVAQLCAWLDGIPLAIELAATRLRSLSVAEVVARLDDRFGFLTCGSRAAQPRQQTLRAMIDWSYELCSPEEQRLWSRLSVFAGSFDLAAAEGVCAGDELRTGAVVDLLDHLVAKSIVMAERHGERVRYRLLMTVREFGDELLGDEEREVLRGRHRDHYRERAEQMAANWCGPGQAAALARMREDHPNLTAALQWSIRATPATAADPGAEKRVAASFAAALRYHWVAGGSLGEGRRWLDQVLNAVDEPCRERAEALWVASWVCLIQGDGAAADERLRECNELAAALGDDLLVSHAAHWSGLAALFRGDLPAAVPLFERAVAGFERAEKAGAMLTAQFQLAVVLAYSGELRSARSLCARALRVAEGFGEQWARAYVRWASGIIEWRDGNVEAADRLARQALSSQRDFHDGICTALSIELLAWIAAHRDDPRRSAQLFGAARAVWAEIGTAMHSFGPHLNGDSVIATRRAEQRVGRERFESLIAEVPSLSLPQAVEFALSGPGSHLVVRAKGGGPPQSSPLSRRELEVAQLIARGLSNKAIAETLVISPRTVDGHVERIFSKLGFSSRAQVAAWIAENG